MTERTAARVRAGLEDPEPEVRRRAAQEIPALPAPESCELLLSALGDDDWRVRKEAAAVATRVEPRTAVVFAVARALAEHENVGLRNAAVEALILIGPDAVPGAIDALGRLDADGRKLAVEVLAGAPTLAGIKTLVRATKDADVNVVIAALEGLGKADLAGEEARELAIATLTALLGGEQETTAPAAPAAAAAPHAAQVRGATLDALRALDAPVPWASLEPLFGDALLRRNAIAAAAGSGAPRALLMLAQAVADPSPTLAREATTSLGRSLEEVWGDEELAEIAARTLRASPAAHARLRALARQARDPARGAALLALGLVRDPDDVSLIAEALQSDDVAERAEAALHLFGDQAVEPLLAAGRSAAPSLRGATISMLPDLASSEAEPLAAVRDALGDTSPEVVAPALKSLAIVGVGADLASVARHARSADAKVASAAHGALLAIAGRHVGPAREMLQGIDPRGDDALWAVIVVGALARAGAEAPSDAAFLASALTHREAAVRRATIDALAVVGGEEAAQAVTVSLADEEAVVALAAIRALGHLGHAEELASLAATTRDPMRLGAVLRALREADPERAFAAARPLVRSRDPSIAAAAIDVVGDVALDGHVEALLSATDHPDHEVVKLALGELAKLGDERALAALASAVEHAAESVRRCAAELLGQFGADGESVLRARLDRERSADVRRSIMQALAVRSTGAG
ncbi:MAG: HEAT repeat domain-containing protein [Labilithrix sp.]|nr:HEAT repeat domain-containing protein [Labilithrix sp.]